ncbi:MAG: hypothetical protein Q4F00_13675 [bacterium]|nr:hypothetical protein [bacterium]
MKRYIPALVLGALVWGAAPASAEMGPDYDMRFDLNYMPLRVSTAGPSGVCSSSLPVVQLSGEGRVFQGFILGASYAIGDGSKLNVVGNSGGGMLDAYQCTDPKYRDLEVYVKIPFNFQDFADADRVVGPRPKMSPFYGYFGYKNTSLRATPPTDVTLSGPLNVEASSGVGVGLGADFAFDPVGVYGKFVYYPSMFTHNVAVDTETPDGKLYVIEWDAGIRTNFKDSPIQARIGYHYEQHKAKNIKLKYDGVQFAASAQF